MNVRQFRWMFATPVLLALLTTLASAQEALWQTHNSAGWKALKVREFAEAQKQFNLAIRQTEQFAPGDIRQAISLTGLAASYQAQGELPQAEALYEGALAIAEKAMGPEDDGVAAILDKLAAVCHAQRQYAKAEPLYKRALAIREKQLDEKHPLIAINLNELASHYADRALYEQSLPLFQRAMKTFLETQGDAHPLTAAAFQNIALLHEKRGDLTEADEFFRAAFATWERAGGAEYPGTAICLHGLARLHASRGEHAKAVPLLEQALTIRQARLGEEHPLVAETLHALAQSQQLQEKLAEAESLYQRSLGVYEKALGANHSQLAEVTHNYATLLEKSERSDEARTVRERHAGAFYARAKERFVAGDGAAGDDAATFLDSRGWSHPDSLQAALIGYFGYRFAGRDDEAEQMLEKAASQADRNIWPYPVISHLKKELPAERLYSLARDDARMSLAQICFGLRLSQSGDHDGALSHLRWVREHAEPQTVEYGMATAEIDRIQLQQQAPKPRKAAPDAVTSAKEATR